MKALRVILILAFILLIGIFAGYVYYGGLDDVDIRMKEQGGEMLLYKEMTGDYQQTGAVITELVAELEKRGVAMEYGFGYFLDDPKKVPKERLRFEAGLIIPARSVPSLTDLFEKYKLRTCPKEKYVITEFSWKGDLSFLISTIKVYPALDRFCRQFNLDPETPVMEIYDQENGMIYYRKKIESKQAS